MTALRFMGREFATAKALQREFPAYGTAARVSAIRAGCDTPALVEAHFAQQVSAKAASRLRTVKASTFRPHRNRVGA